MKQTEMNELATQTLQEIMEDRESFRDARSYEHILLTRHIITKMGYDPDKASSSIAIAAQSAIESAVDQGELAEGEVNFALHSDQKDKRYVLAGDAEKWKHQGGSHRITRIEKRPETIDKTDDKTQLVFSAVQTYLGRKTTLTEELRILDFLDNIKIETPRRSR